jgi:hypothetical protein
MAPEPLWQAGVRLERERGRRAEVDGGVRRRVGAVRPDIRRGYGLHSAVVTFPPKRTMEPLAFSEASGVRADDALEIDHGGSPRSVGRRVDDEGARVCPRLRRR